MTLSSPGIALLSLVLAAVMALSGCAGSPRTTVINAEGETLAIRYTIPDRTRLDSEIRDALQRFLGDSQGQSLAEGSSAIPLAPTIDLRVMSATIKLLPFIFDQDSQNREYLAEFTSRTEMWFDGRKVDEWELRRQRPFSVRPRQHQRNERLREIRADLAPWAVQEWLAQLRWQAANLSRGDYQALETLRGNRESGMESFPEATNLEEISE